MESFKKYCEDAAIDYAMRPDAARDNVIKAIAEALKTAYAWRSEPLNYDADEVVALLEKAKQMTENAPQSA